MKVAGIVALTLSLLAASPISASPLTKRRFGQEHAGDNDALFAQIRSLSDGTDQGNYMGVLSGVAVNALLAKAGACAQQDVADTILGGFDAFIAGQVSDAKARRTKAVGIAKKYRVLERNFNGVGPSPECSRKALSPELQGLVHKQDPAFKGKAKDIPKQNSKYLDCNGGDQEVLQSNRADVEKALGGKFQDGTSGSSDKPKGKGKDGGKDKPKGKGKDGGKDKPKGKGKDGGKDKPKGKGKDGGKDKPKGKGKDCDKGKGKESPKGKGKESPKGKGSKVNNVAFTNPLGGIQMPKIKKLANGKFSVKDSEFVNLGAAHTRQCDVQHNLCANGFNVDKNPDIPNVGACDDQNEKCKAGDAVFE